MSLLDLSPCPILYSEKNTPVTNTGDDGRRNPTGIGTRERKGSPRFRISFFNERKWKGGGMWFSQKYKNRNIPCPGTLVWMIVFSIFPFQTNRARPEPCLSSSCRVQVLFSKRLFLFCSFFSRNRSVVKELRPFKNFVCASIISFCFGFVKRFFTFSFPSQRSFWRTFQRASRSFDLVVFSSFLTTPHIIACGRLMSRPFSLSVQKDSGRLSTVPSPPPMYGSTCQAVVEQWLPGAYLGMFFELALFSGFLLMCPQFSVVEMQPSSVDA